MCSFLKIMGLQKSDFISKNGAIQQNQTVLRFLYFTVIFLKIALHTFQKLL